MTPPGSQHLALPLVGDSCVFVSHQRPFPQSMVLRRSLESTPPLTAKRLPPPKKIQGIKTKIQTGHLHKTVDDTLQVNPSRNVRRIRNRRNSHFLKYRRVLFSKIQFILPSRRNSSRAPDRSIREFNSPICRRNQVVVCMLAYFRLKRTLPTKAHREQF